MSWRIRIEIFRKMLRTLIPQNWSFLRKWEIHQVFLILGFNGFKWRKYAFRRMRYSCKYKMPMTWGYERPKKLLRSPTTFQHASTKFISDFLHYLPSRWLKEFRILSFILASATKPAANISYSPTCEHSSSALPFVRLSSSRYVPHAPPNLSFCIRALLSAHEKFPTAFSETISTWLHFNFDRIQKANEDDIHE